MSRRKRFPNFARALAEAHYQLECDYNMGGWLHERPSNRRRREATACQLARMGWTTAYRLPIAPGDSLSAEVRAIYRQLEIRYGFIKVLGPTPAQRTRNIH